MAAIMPVVFISLIQWSDPLYYRAIKEYVEFETNLISEIPADQEMAQFYNITLRIIRIDHLKFAYFNENIQQTLILQYTIRCLIWEKEISRIALQTAGEDPDLISDAKALYEKDKARIQREIENKKR